LDWGTSKIADQQRSQVYRSRRLSRRDPPLARGGIVSGHGRFRAELTLVRLNRVPLHRSDEALPRVTHPAVDPALFLVAFSVHPDQQFYLGGLEAAHADIFAFSAGSSEYNRLAAGCRWRSIAVPHEDIAAAGEAITARELTAPSVTRRIKPPPAFLNRLLNLHEAAGHLAKTTPDMLVKPEVARAMDQAVVEAMVGCQVSGDPADDRSAYRHHAKVVRRLEEALRAGSERSLYMDDMCKAIRASHRTLHVCCREHLGMSPKQYLLLRRMHLARRALSRGDPQKTSVTEIATDYGFWELGRFSVAYRSLFGESPSTTLRRQPDDPAPIDIAGASGQFAESA
jgi:AraC-like DNA-binding protein